MPMADYLSTVTPDYTAVNLDVSPRGISPSIFVTGRKYQEIDDYYGGSSTRIDWGNDPEFFVVLPFGYLNTGDMQKIWQLYMSPSKANGVARTFVWDHPTETNNYVVRFYNEIERWHTPSLKFGIDGIVLKVLGNYVP